MCVSLFLIFHTIYFNHISTWQHQNIRLSPEPFHVWPLWSCRSDSQEATGNIRLTIHSSDLTCGFSHHLGSNRSHRLALSYFLSSRDIWQAGYKCKYFHKIHYCNDLFNKEVWKKSIHLCQHSVHMHINVSNGFYEKKWVGDIQFCCVRGGHDLFKCALCIWEVGRWRLCLNWCLDGCFPLCIQVKSIFKDDER